MRISDWSSDVCSSDLLCVQGLILEDEGYVCEEGVLYFVESRERVTVAFDEELRDLTLSAIHGLRGVALGGRIPTPLDDSPNCPRCSLVGICLPDEVNFLRRGETPPRSIAVGLTVTYRSNSARSEEHTSELQSLMRTSYAVFCLNKQHTNTHQ